MACNHAKRFAVLYFAAIAAGGKTFALGAFADGAERLAERRFGAFDAATGAVDHLRRDFHFVEFRPFLRDFCTQLVVVVDGGKSGFAFFTVESAASDVVVHNNFSIERSPKMFREDLYCIKYGLSFSGRVQPQAFAKRSKFFLTMRLKMRLVNIIYISSFFQHLSLMLLIDPMEI